MSIFAGESGEGNAESIIACQDSALLHDAVLTAVQRGWLLSFGSSRDGGAVSIGITSDEGKDRVWAGTAAEAERALRAVVAAGGGSGGVSAGAGGSAPSGGPTGASRGKAAGGKGPSKSGA